MEGKAAMKGQALSWDERRRGVGGKKTAEAIRGLKCLWGEIKRRNKCCGVC